MRLERGQDEKIDRINDLVYDAKINRNNDSMTSLLEMFHPMIVGLCRKWGTYFNDELHKLKSMEDLIADAQTWFIVYTIDKYIIDGSATYNKFIKDHINQRIRFIYETELKYYSRNIFPDADKWSEDDDCSASLENVVFNYTQDHHSMEDDIIDSMVGDSKIKLARLIIAMVDDTSVFNPREKNIFIDIICNGKTHEEVGKNIGISRTRVSQILQKVKNKLYREMEISNEVWEMICESNVEFKER